MKSFMSLFTIVTTSPPSFAHTSFALSHFPTEWSTLRHVPEWELGIQSLGHNFPERSTVSDNHQNGTSLNTRRKDKERKTENSMERKKKTVEIEMKSMQHSCGPLTRLVQKQRWRDFVAALDTTGCKGSGWWWSKNNRAQVPLLTVQHCVVSCLFQEFLSLAQVKPS